MGAEPLAWTINWQSGGGWLLVLFASAFIAAGAGAATTQRNFASPEAAVEALVQAVKAQDRAGTLAVLGADAAAWISSGDAADRSRHRGTLCRCL